MTQSILKQKLKKTNQMNAIKNKSGTVDLVGMTEREALLLMSVMGNINWSNGVFSALINSFPEYQKIWSRNRYPKGCLTSATIEVSDEKRVLHEKIIQDVLDFYHPKVKKIASFQNSQRRDSNGRFAKKVWVARFNYPDSQNRWNNVARIVITNLLGRGRPLLLDYHSIEGIDLARGAFRKFNVNRIIGHVKWAKEYASDIC